MHTSRNGLPENLGEYVRQKREKAGLSQRQLAQEAGVSFSNISRLESGFHLSPSPGLLKNIADVLDVDLAELLGYLGIEVAGSGSLNDYSTCGGIMSCQTQAWRKPRKPSRRLHRNTGPASGCLKTSAVILRFCGV